jgi:tripartite-type tricarboxylate transporter receptor subunit TctC
MSRFCSWRVATLLVPLLATSPALAESGYPNRPVRILAGVAAGGAPDIVARLVGQWLGDRMVRSFIVDNRPGAGGNLATEAVVRAEPDGYTLLLFAPSSAINATLYENLAFNFIRDIAPVASIMRSPEVLVVHPSVPAKTLPEFITYAKANAGKLNMASAGNGSGPHLSGVLLMMMSGTTFSHIPYRSGAQALTDLIAGRVDLTFVSSGFAVEHIRAGKVRALGVTTETRSQLLPDVPAISEFLPGYESSTWFGLGAPKDTPTGLVEKLNREVNAALSQPDVKARINSLDAVPFPGTPAQFGKFIAEETEKKRKIIKGAGIKLQ